MEKYNCLHRHRMQSDKLSLHNTPLLCNLHQHIVLTKKLSFNGQYHVFDHVTYSSSINEGFTERTQRIPALPSIKLASSSKITFYLTNCYITWSYRVGLACRIIIATVIIVTSLCGARDRCLTITIVYLKMNFFASIKLPENPLNALKLHMSD